MEARDFIERLASASEAMAWQAGVGAAEMAGAAISYLAEHPDALGDFITRGFMGLPPDLWAEGRLTFLNQAGKVTTPQELRLANAARQMTKLPPLAGEQP